MNVTSFEDEDDRPRLANLRSPNDDEDEPLDSDDLITDEPDQYYAILNLSRTATHDQITKRYKQLAGKSPHRSHCTPFH